MVGKIIKCVALFIILFKEILKLDKIKKFGTFSEISNYQK